MLITPKLNISDELDVSGETRFTIKHGTFNVSTPIAEEDAVRMVKHLAALFGTDLTHEDFQPVEWFCSTSGRPAIDGRQYFKGACTCLKTGRCEHQVPF